MTPILKANVPAQNSLQFESAGDFPEQQREVVKHQRLIIALNEFTDKKTIKKPTMGAALIGHTKKEFKMDRQNSICYAKLNCPRLLDMLRMVSQASCRDPVPMWAHCFVPADAIAEQQQKKARKAGSKDTILVALSETTPLVQQAPAVDLDHDETQLAASLTVADDADRQNDSARDYLPQSEADHDRDPLAEILEVVAAPVSTPVLQTWMFGWCPHAKKAWRARPDQPGSREYTDKLTKASKPDDAPLASWPDGATWSVSSLTSACIPDDMLVDEPPQPLNSAESPAVATAGSRLPLPRTHFTGRTGDKLPVVVKDRFDRDRPPLVSFFLSASQVCQVPIEKIGHAEAIKCLCSLGKQLCDGTIKREDLYPLRNRMLGLSRGGPRSRLAAKTSVEAFIDDKGEQAQAIMKRPAALASSASASASSSTAMRLSGAILESEARDSDDEMPLGMFDIWKGFF